MSLRKLDVELALRDGAWRSQEELRNMVGCGSGAEIGQLAAMLDTMVMSGALAYDEKRARYALPAVPSTDVPGAGAVAVRQLVPAPAAPEPARPRRTAADLRDLLWDTIDALKAGTIEESRAREVSRLANSIIGVATTEMEHQKHMKALGDAQPGEMLLGRSEAR